MLLFEAETPKDAMEFVLNNLMPSNMYCPFLPNGSVGTEHHKYLHAPRALSLVRKIGPWGVEYCLRQIDD